MDKYADIVPFKSMAGIRFSTRGKNLKKILDKSLEPVKIFSKYDLTYNIDNIIEININALTGCIYKFTALKNYKGYLFKKIHIGMHIDDVLRLEPSFVYDDWLEIYESSKGIIIETDPITHEVIWISIYPKGLDLDNTDIFFNL